MTDWAIFLGRFHPLIVHLPIGLLLLAALMGVWARWQRQPYLQAAIPFVLWLGWMSGVGACAAGYLLSFGGEYDPDLLALHQWLGIGTTAVAFLVWWLVRSETPPAELVRIGLYVGVSALVGATGHYGGSLTHGEDYLTQYLPEPFRGLAGLPPREQEVVLPENPDEILAYEHLVAPVLQQRCVSCHHAGKSKGGLRMDGPEWLLKGGESGPLWVAGDAPNSELIKRVRLPDTDEHHMPPKGKPQLTDPQIALLEWWIGQGADFEKKLGEMPDREPIAAYLVSLGIGASGEKSFGVLEKPVAAHDVAAVEKLQQAGALCLPVAKGSAYLQVDFPTNPQTVSDSTLQLLLPLSQQVTWLDLKKTGVTDAGLATLAQLPHLTKLELQQTALTDAGLVHLANLAHLESLNLFGTQVTAAGLEQLVQLPQLRTVYLWQTALTAEQLTDLTTRFPKIEWVGGVSP